MQEGQEDEEDVGGRAGTVPAIKLVREEVVRQRAAVPIPRGRGEVRCRTRRATSKYICLLNRSSKKIETRISDRGWVASRFNEVAQDISIARTFSPRSFSNSY